MTVERPLTRFEELLGRRVEPAEPTPPPQWEQYVKKHGWGKMAHLRCKNVETRLVSSHLKRPFEYHEKQVRCILWNGHPEPCTWGGREFGGENVVAK